MNHDARQRETMPHMEANRYNAERKALLWRYIFLFLESIQALFTDSSTPACFRVARAPFFERTVEHAPRPEHTLTYAPNDCVHNHTTIPLTQGYAPALGKP